MAEKAGLATPRGSPLSLATEWGVVRYMAERHILTCSICNKTLAEWRIGLIAKNYKPADLTEEVIMVDECPHSKVGFTKYNAPTPIDAIKTIWEDDKKWYFVPLVKGAKIKIEVKDDDC